MMINISAHNSSYLPITLISDDENLNGYVMPPNTSQVFTLTVPEGLKCFTKKVIKNNQPHFWIGFVDKDAPII